MLYGGTKHWSNTLYAHYINTLHIPTRTYATHLHLHTMYKSASSMIPTRERTREFTVTFATTFAVRETSVNGCHARNNCLPYTCVPLRAFWGRVRIWIGKKIKPFFDSA